MSVASPQRRNKVLLVLASVFAIFVYSACELEDELNADATYKFANRANAVSLPQTAISGNKLNATITNQRTWSVANRNWFSWAAANEFEQTATFQFNGFNPGYIYDTVAYCEVLNNSGATILQRGRSFGNSGALNNVEGYSGGVYLRNAQAPENDTFCDFDIGSLSEGNYTLRFGKGRAWRTDWKTVNGTPVSNYFFDRQEGAAASLPFRIDRSAPFGGELTVNNQIASQSWTWGYNTSGVFQIEKRIDWSDAGGLNQLLSGLYRERAPLLNNNCGKVESSAKIEGTPEQWGMSNGCYYYKLQGVDQAGTSKSIAAAVKVDTTPPSGGRVISPETSQGNFDLLLTPFQDETTGIASSSLERRNAAFVAGSCPNLGDNELWGSWETTNNAQRSLANGCWHYRLTATNAAGSSAAANSVTQVGAPGPVESEITVLSLRGPKKVKRGQRAVFVLRMQNTGDDSVVGLSTRAVGRGIQSRAVNTASILQLATQNVRLPMRFTKQGRIVATFVIENRQGIRKVLYRTVRVG